LFAVDLRDAVLSGTAFNGREKNAIGPLKWLQKNWPSVISEVRSYDKCGLCDPYVCPSDHVSNRYEVNNLYAGKMWSQLFYDSLVPFDWKSKARIKKAGYPDPTKAFFAMSRKLFHDLRRLSDVHRLEVPGIRQLDSPWMVVPRLRKPTGGQPLSRVLDKIFYRP
jgi:hypothetical protein